MWFYVPSFSAMATEDSSWASDLRESGLTLWLVQNGRVTQRPSSWPTWKKKSFMRLLSGTISQPSLANSSADEWISSRRASLASPSPRPDNERVLRMTVGSGRGSPRLSVMWDRVSSSWRTSLDSSSTDSSTYSPTLPSSGSMRSGVLSQRKRWEPPIGAIASGSSPPWPTTTTQDAKRSGSTSSNPSPTLTDAAVRNWPTPAAIDSTNPRRPDADSGSFLTLAEMSKRPWHTPTARDTRASGQPDSFKDRKGSPPLTDQAAHWPTPKAHDSRPTRRNQSKLYSPDLSDTAVNLWPTPKASEMARGSDPARGPRGGSPSLKHEAEHSPHSPTTPADGESGSDKTDLNPRFVESLMGVPQGWLSPSTLEETAWCRWWQQQRSAFLRVVS